MGIKNTIIKMLRETADKIEVGTCEMSDTEAMELLSILSHRAMSKEDTCIYLNISRSRFDDLVREGKLPKGRKRRGFKELVFYQNELDASIRNA